MLNEAFASLPACNTLSKLEAALHYAKIAPVFPLRPHTKLPLLRGSWPTYATQDESLIRQWWEQFPEANIAWVMGGELLCSDLDMKDGENGWSSYQELAPGDVESPLQMTPSNGYHVLHAFAPDLINFTKQGTQGGIDLRTTNGYIVAAPSSTPDGDYKWLHGGPLEPLPDPALNAYLDWSTASTVDRDVDMPESTPYDDLKPLEDLMIRGKHLEFLQNGTIGESYGGDRSRALLGATVALYQSGLSDEDVLGYLESSPGSIDCAQAHSTDRRAALWLWKYNCIKAREKVTVTTVVTADEAFKDVVVADGTPSTNNPPSVPGENDRARWVRLAEAMDPHDEDAAIKIYREAAHISPIFANQVADIIQQVAGFRKSDLEKAAKSANRTVALSMKTEGQFPIRRTGDCLPEGHPVLAPPSSSVETWPEFVGRYVYISTEHRWLDRYTRETLTPEALNAKEAHIMEALSLEEGSEVKLRASDALSARRDTLKVDTRSYWPGIKDDLIHVDKGDAVNTWQPSPLELIEGDISPWWELFCHLFPKEESRNNILDWMAFILQKPHIKINYALLIGGGQRIGKDSIFQPLIHGVGLRNSNNIKAEMLGEKYDDHFIGIKLAVIQEIHRDGFRDAREIENKLKVYLADPPTELVLRRLGATNATQRNLIQLIAFTNYEDALHLTSDGDRYLCEWSHASKLPPAQYKKVYDWYDKEQGYGKVCHYLMQRDVSNFNPKASAPDTPWRREMITSGKSDLDYQVEDIIDKIKQDNIVARKLRVEAEAQGKVINNANAHLYQEVSYITTRQVMSRLEHDVKLPSKAIVSILQNLGVRRLRNATDHRFRIPRAFVEDAFSGVQGRDKFKGSFKTHVYQIDNLEGSDDSPPIGQIKMGLCPPRLINEYLTTLD